MSDITMCSGDNCPLKETCYRYLAPKSEYQSYFIDAPVTKNGKCLYYWEYEKEVKVKEE